MCGTQDERERLSQQLMFRDRRQKSEVQLARKFKNDTDQTQSLHALQISIKMGTHGEYLWSQTLSEFDNSSCIIL